MSKDSKNKHDENGVVGTDTSLNAGAAVSTSNTPTSTELTDSETKALKQLRAAAWGGFGVSLLFGIYLAVYSLSTANEVPQPTEYWLRIFALDGGLICGVVVCFALARHKIDKEKLRLALLVCLTINALAVILLITGFTSGEGNSSGLFIIFLFVLDTFYSVVALLKINDIKSALSKIEQKKIISSGFSSLFSVLCILLLVIGLILALSQGVFETRDAQYYKAEIMKAESEFSGTAEGVSYSLDTVECDDSTKTCEIHVNYVFEDGKCKTFFEYSFSDLDSGAELTDEYQKQATDNMECE